ncbi:MAG: hypothetical protein VB072_02805 [Lentimicrobium sp.]|jgi:hypothetical protein|uniref:hypothetical protein n=1 Tax=Lentimicrobium sp. TaxID=2034841 RepID=UPI002B1F998E|nr:hypothetical protein [Lentimicrobium sp.]MEA5109331.1 hypothetical protein [Lentimicrobium sp.]
MESPEAKILFRKAKPCRHPERNMPASNLRKNVSFHSLYRNCIEKIKVLFIKFYSLRITVLPANGSGRQVNVLITCTINGQIAGIIRLNRREGILWHLHIL